jgi:hypothetical protein
MSKPSCRSGPVVLGLSHLLASIYKVNAKITTMLHSREKERGIKYLGISQLQKDL